jgi:intein/homing endonuclease
MAFSFTPCIASNTKLATITKKGKLKWVKAKNIKTGTKVYSPTWDEFKSEEIESPYESTVQYDALTNLRMETGEIVYIKPRPVEKTIVINNNTKKRFSSTQPLLIVKKSDPKKHSWVFAGDVKPGDFLWEYDFDERRFKKIIVKSVKVSNKKDTVYAFDVQGFDTFISGNIVCHNLMKV